MWGHGPKLYNWVLGLGREHEYFEDDRMVINGSNSRLKEQDTNGGGSPRRNTSSDKLSTDQI